MQKSDLIIHTAKKPFFCCCYYDKTLMLAATSESVQLWDFLKGEILGSLQFKCSMAPIAIIKIKIESQYTWFQLQDKGGTILIFTLASNSSGFNLQSQYKIGMIGFTKLPIRHYKILESKPIDHQIKDFYTTINYPNKIQRRQLLSGKVQTIFELQHTNFTDITCLLSTTIDGLEYLLVAEEGATIRKILIKSQTIEAQEQQKISVLTDQQIKIILWIQPISYDRALVILREDKVGVICLRKLSFDRFIDIKLVRIIKSISSQHDKWAMVGKQHVGFIKDQKVVKKQKVQTNLIMDMDICEYGIVGVSQEGKLFFLPQEEQ